MANHNFKSISDIVEEVVEKHLPSGDVDALSKQLQRIRLCWPQCTGETLSQQVKPIRLDNNELIVQTHSPVWANKMRFLQNSTIIKLNRLGFVQIDSIRIRVNPAIAE